MEGLTFSGLPLTEFDNDRFSMLDPMRMKDIGLPPPGVIVFYGRVVESLVNSGRLLPTHTIESILYPVKIYRTTLYKKDLTVVCPPGCGGPVAGALIEELIALGCRKLVACGSAGCLQSELKKESVVIPSGAIRDEGISFHYLPPSRTITADPAVVAKLAAVLARHNIKYEVGLNWTTDAPYRETRQKVARRKKEGCLTVEMEFAAMLAVAHFRRIPFGQYLLAGDDVGADEWDSRNWSDNAPAHERLFSLAAEAVLEL